MKGPVTRRTPWSRCLRRTTRLPRKRPARRIRTVPGWRLSRSLVGRTVLRACSDQLLESLFLIPVSIPQCDSVHIRPPTTPDELSHRSQKTQFNSQFREHCTDFLGLRVFINGIPLLGLLLRLRDGPLALSKLLRLSNSGVRHFGCWGRRWLEKKVGEGGGCRRRVVEELRW